MQPHMTLVEEKNDKITTFCEINESRLYLPLTTCGNATLRRNGDTRTVSLPYARCDVSLGFASS
jgi:hypothetical protein